jgi:Flp pilus assembly protein TadG
VSPRLAAAGLDPSPLAGPRRGRAGAVYVEFLIAFFPVFFFFLALVQLIFLQTASLVVHHAASKAVRAAVVVLPDDPAYYGDVPVGSFTGQRKTDIERAAKIPLAAMGLLEAAAAKVTIEGAYGRNAVLKAKVEYQYHCKVPWGRFLLCGLTNFKKITAEASMTNQGALYDY